MTAATTPAHPTPEEPAGGPQWGAEGLSIRSGTMEVRLARTEAEIDASQALRYRVFYEEMAARPTPDMACLLYTSPSPRDRTRSRMPSSA